MSTRSAQALRTIARVKPEGAGHQRRRRHRPGGADRDFTTAAISATTPPPVAVLPNGKTNLIAHDLGADGDPIEALERVLELVRTDMVPHIVSRELIALSGGSRGGRPVLGMFLGGAGARRHDALLPPQNLSARPAQRRRRIC